MDQTLAGRAVNGRRRLPRQQGMIMPYRKHFADLDVPPWQEELKATQRRIRARIEHALAGMKTWKVLRDYRRTASTARRQHPRRRQPALRPSTHLVIYPRNSGETRLLANHARGR